MRFFPKKSISLASVFLLIIFFGLWVSNLEYRKLIGPDEGRYAEIAREMVISGDWITPKLNDLKYLEKPPLQYWTTATAFTLFGEHHWAARFWPALTGFLGVLLVAWTSKRLFGNEAGWISGSVLGGSLWYVAMSHLNTLDMGLTFFLTLALCSFLCAQQRETITEARPAMLMAWVAMALAVLSKGVIGVVIPGATLVLYSLFSTNVAVWRRMHWGKGIAVFLLIVAPWFIAVASRNPEFLRFFFIHEHLQRFASEGHRREGVWYYFLVILPVGILPWTSLWLRTLLQCWRSMWSKSGSEEGFNPERFLVIWIVFIVGFFSISQSKLPSYILPVFPAIALLMGRQIPQLATITVRRWLIPVYAFGAGLILLALRIEWLVDDPEVIHVYQAYRVWLITAAMVLIAGVTLARWYLAQNRRKIAFIGMGFSGLIAVQIAITGHEIFSYGSSSYHLVRQIEAAEGPFHREWPFFSIRMYDQTLPFYLKRPLTLVKYYDEMTLGLEAEPDKGIPKIEEWVELWAELDQGYALLKPENYQDLMLKGVPMRLLGRDTRRAIVARR